jgi:phage gpG-like protein
MKLSYKKAEPFKIGTPKAVNRSVKIPGLLELDNVTEDVKGVDQALDNAYAIALKAAEDAVPDLIDRLGAALDAALRSSVWSWNDGTRDIVDTGQLLASRSITVSGNTIVIDYKVPYFGIIHFGGYIMPYGNDKAKKVYIPARPWVTSVVEGGGPVPQFDFAAVFRESLKSIR